MNSLRTESFRALAASLALLFGGLDAQAAGGTVTFANNSSSKVINGQTTNPVTTNDTIQAALYWAPPGSNNFTQIGAPAIVGIPLPGLFAGGTRTTETGAGGQSAQFQVRAWSGGYSTYEQAVQHGGVLIGQSAIIQILTGNPDAVPPTPPNSLVGLSSFTLTSNEVSSLTLTCETNKTVECGDAWSFDQPNVTDTCGNTNVTVSILSTSTNGQCPQVISRTWLATDSCGNTNICSQTVTLACSNCTVIALTKSCPSNAVPPGGTLAFSGTVSNAGIITLTNVVVLNDQPAPGTVVFGPGTLTPGASANFAGSYRVAPCFCGPFSDTLVATGTSLEGIVYSNSVTASCPGASSYAVPGDLNGDGIVDQNELNAVLSNYWGNSAWIYMTNPASLGQGVFQFALTNASGWNFTVLVSSNLMDWTNLPGPAYPVYQFFDPAAASNAPNRYYRLRYP